MTRLLSVIIVCVIIISPLNVQGEGVPRAPEYKGGADSNGLTNSGTSANGFANLTFGSQGSAVSGNYLFVVTSASSTACSSSASAAGNGCELKVFDISNKTIPTYVAGGDATGSTNAGTGNLSFGGIVIIGNYAYTVEAANNTACSATPGSGLGCELKVWDISTPTNPTYVAGGDAGGQTNAGTGSVAMTKIVQIPGTNNVAIASAVSAASCGGAAGALRCELMIWDVSTPTSPTYLGGADVGGGTNTGVQSLGISSVAAISGYVFTTNAASTTDCDGAGTSNFTGCELKIWDVSTPASPTYVAGVDVTGSINDGVGGINSNGISAQGNFVYFTTNGDGTTCSGSAGSAIGCELKIIDISTPASPTYAAGVDANGSRNAGSVSGQMMDVVANGNYLYVARNGNSTACSASLATGCELQVYDITTPSTITYLAGGDASGTTNSGTSASAPSNIDVSGNYLYQLGNGDAATCGASPSAGGCELRIWESIQDIGGRPTSFQRGWSFIRGIMFLR
jgi:hypothetical protein